MYFVPNVNNADAFTGQLHTGDPDGLYWDPPTLPQNFVIRFPNFTLSAADGDFTDAGITITSEVGDSEDITIGNAPAKILSATALNPEGLMDGLDWGIGKVAITVPGLETIFDGTGYIIYAEREGQQYGFTNTEMDAPNATANYNGEPQAIVIKSNGYAYFITDEVVYFYNGSGFAPFDPATDLQKFEVDKYKKYQNIGVYLGDYDVPPFDDPDPAKTWVVNEDDPTQSLRHTVIDLPVGTFDFSNVDAHGITFGIEVYDLMTRFDADATAWVQSLDFTTPMTIVDILESLLSELGYQSNYTINVAAVNTALTYSENPITAYAVTYRQVLKWIAEAMGCNARMSREGKLVLKPWNSTTVGQVTPYTIISNSRTMARYSVPQITKVVAYDTLGIPYSSGLDGSTYYISANPFLTGLDVSVTPLTNILSLLSTLPAYYPYTISEMYADPRLDEGDWITLRPPDFSAGVSVPIMRLSHTWNHANMATLTASGNQTRTVPDGLVENNLATTVNGRKILEGVDAKRITVLDENENILFNADTETDKVQIAGFTVTDTEMTATETIADTPQDQIKTVTVGTDGFQTSLDYYEGSEMGYAHHVETGDFSQGSLTLDSESTIGQLTYHAQTIINGSARVTQNADAPDNYLRTDVTGADVRMELHSIPSGGTSGTDDKTILLDANTGAMSVNKGEYTGTVTHNSIGVDDGNGVETSVKYNGVAFADASGSAVPRFSVLQRTRVTAGTTTVTLANGVYLAITTHQNNSTAGQSGLAVIQVNSNSSVLNIATAANSTLSISGQTLTWTTTNTYRQLYLIKLTTA